MQTYGIKSQLIRPAKRWDHDTETQENNQNIKIEKTDPKVIHILVLVSRHEL